MGDFGEKKSGTVTVGLINGVWWEMTSTFMVEHCHGQVQVINPNHKLDLLGFYWPSGMEDYIKFGKIGHFQFFFAPQQD